MHQSLLTTVPVGSEISGLKSHVLTSTLSLQFRGSAGLLIPWPKRLG